MLFTTRLGGINILAVLSLTSPPKFQITLNIAFIFSFSKLMRILHFSPRRRFRLRVSLE